MQKTLVKIEHRKIRLYIRFESRDLASLETILISYEIRRLIFRNPKNATLLPTHMYKQRSGQDSIFS